MANILWSLGLIPEIRQTLIKSYWYIVLQSADKISNKISWQTEHI